MGCRQEWVRTIGLSTGGASLRGGFGAETLWCVLGASPDEERVRTAELIGALCLATDLGMGFPFEHGLHETLIAMRLAERLRVDRETASQTYYTSLLSHAGCTAEAHVAAQVFGGSMTENFNPLMYGSVREVFTGLLRSLPDEDVTGLARAAQTARRLPRMARETRPALTASCEVAGMLAEQTGAPTAVPDHLVLPDRPLGRPRSAGARKTRGDPAADADRPRRHRRRLPAPPRGRRACGGHRRRARRPRLRPRGGGLPGRGQRRDPCASTTAAPHGTKRSPWSPRRR